MKKNPEMRIFLLSMLANIIITYLMGYKFKDFMLSTLSAPVYYQLLVFISLCLPLLIKFGDRKIRVHLLDSNIKKLRDSQSTESTEGLDEDTLKKLEVLTNTNFKKAEMIKEMHDALEELKK